MQCHLAGPAPLKSEEEHACPVGPVHKVNNQSPIFYSFLFLSIILGSVSLVLTRTGH